MLSKGNNMKEIDVIKHAKNYMDMLSKGVNPITKEKYPQNSDINNERLLKCFSFVAEILDKVITREAENVNYTETLSKLPDEKNQNSKTPTPDLKAVNIQETNQNDNSNEPLYFPNSLVSEDLEGIDVVNTLIEKGLIKQGIKNKNQGKV